MLKGHLTGSGLGTVMFPFLFKRSIFLNFFRIHLQKKGGFWPPFSPSIFGEELKLVALLFATQIEQLFIQSTAF